MKKSDISLSSIEPFFEKIGKLSRLQRILISSGIFLVIIGSFVYFSYYPKFKTKKKLNKQIQNLEKDLAIAKKNAKDLKKFQGKIKEAKGRFKMVMQSLPEKEEIPSLLSGISLSGQDSGLEFLLFQPKNEQRKDFYAEIPVSIKVTGNYHNIVLFFDKVARLSRIVNIKDIKIAVMKKSDDKLNTSCTAVTYKFIEPKPKKKQPKKKGRKTKK